MSHTKTHTDDTTGDNLKKVAVGAAVLAAGAAVINALRDQDTRAKVGETAKTVSEKAMEVAGKIKDKGAEMLSNLATAGNDIIADLATKFEDLQTQIEESDFADKLEAKVADLAAKFKDARDAGEETADEVAADLEKGLEKLQADFEKASA